MPIPDIYTDIAEELETWDSDDYASDSSFDTEKTYDVDRILAQRIENERASWEPARSFEARSIIRQWKRQYSLERKGLAKPFDVDALKRKQDERVKALKKRHKARKLQANKKTPAKLECTTPSAISLENSSVTTTTETPGPLKTVTRGRPVIPDSEDSSEDDSNPDCSKIAPTVPGNSVEHQMHIDTTPKEPSENRLLPASESILAQEDSVTIEVPTPNLANHATNPSVCESAPASMSKLNLQKPTIATNSTIQPAKNAVKQMERISNPASPSKLVQKKVTVDDMPGSYSVKDALTFIPGNTLSKAPMVDQAAPSNVIVGQQKVSNKPRARIIEVPTLKETYQELLGGIAGSARPLIPGKEGSKIVNNPVTKRRRVESEPSRAPNDDQFQKISQRRRAELRGRIDRVPTESLYIPEDEGVETSLALSDRPEQMSDIRQEHTGHKGKVPQICYHWLKGGGCQRKIDCPFLHVDDTENYEISDEMGRVPQKYWNPPQTCWYWFNSKCRLDDRHCDFAHENTGLIGPNPQKHDSETTLVDRSELPISMRRQSHQNPLVTPAPALESIPIPKKQTTCYHWKRYGVCKWGDGCWYAHEDMSNVAQPPKVDRPCVYHQKGGCNKGEKCQFVHGTGHIEAGLRQEDMSPNSPAFKESTREENPTVDMDVDSSCAAQVQSIVPMKESATSIGMSFSVHCAYGAQGFEATLTGLNAATRDRLHDVAGHDLMFSVDNLCLKVDFHSLVYEGDGTILAQGLLSPFSDSITAYHTFRQFLDTRGLFALVLHREFTLVLHPSTTKPILHLQILMPILGVTRPIIPKMHEVDCNSTPDETSLQMLFRQRYGVTNDYLFQGPGVDDGQLDKNVFLMFDEQSHRSDLNLWKTFLLDSHVSVFDCSVRGSWDYFVGSTKIKKGVIILHSEILSLHKIKDLWKILYSNKYNFFSARPIQTWKIPVTRDSSPERVISRLFPTGTLILITDDVFVQSAKEAFTMMECLDREHIRRGKKTRVAGRPGLVDWLTDNLLSSEDKYQTLREKTIVYLDKCAHDVFIDEPAFPSRLISLPRDEMPQYHQTWERDEAEATDHLVNWFAGTCELHADSFRRFIVVHPDPPSTTWANKYQHLNLMKPERCIEFLKAT
ncbi:hypothetical protein EJ05DRAFT_513414 [Pseudovirgaria hyperparasitica]|uniref:C3H1-type domain-containing protein n=1 Tax=Pseudovirgaria hyperparasitica TaxID=470096 RepID=A0A6A6VYZ3_9PEZI|nr:uncharacterized protein EJ05DRAFT_513414 [Pseudovirgaria hyperparasitica]KAF2755099.1 hypothetical protein EJ05DRAFT_513414 [Pseudovirgaria hyperparasitica]